MDYGIIRKTSVFCVIFFLFKKGRGVILVSKVMPHKRIFTTVLLTTGSSLDSSHSLIFQPRQTSVKRFFRSCSASLIYCPKMMQIQKTQSNDQKTQLNGLFVKKRNGGEQNVSFDKVLRRMQNLCVDPALSPLHIDSTIVAQKVCSQIYPGVTTAELDELAANICHSMCTIDPEYNELAKRIAVSNHHKNTNESFKATVGILYNAKSRTGVHSSLVSKELYEIVETHHETLQKELDFNRDYSLDYFGFKTLEKGYLLRLEDKTVVERPQHTWMRVALGLYGTDIEGVIRCYNELSQKKYTHATPTLFNSGTCKNQLASCFLLSMRDDSIKGIFETLGQCATISKHAGGIGLHVHNVRATGSWIRGTNGTSNGLVPMLRVFNDTARYVDQGGGKRNGSFAIYLEPWHSDIEEFLHLKRNHGDESQRARDLFYALWISDLFMERVQSNQPWTLFDPDSAPGLDAVYGEDFNKLYRKYEDDGLGKSTMEARKLFLLILESLVETGTPYILFKDACNKKSNQQNLGTIRSSNLCTEIIQYSSKEETAVCNLASICLPEFVKELPSWSDKEVVMYVKEGCPFCGLAKERLKRMGCSTIKLFLFDDNTDRTTFKSAFAEQADKDGRITFPQIVVDGEQIGGFGGLVSRTRQEFDFEKLGEISKSLVRNLNCTIDRTFYPIPETACSNLRHRPMGIGVQGLADVFYKMRHPFDSKEARDLNKQIFATIYYNAVSESSHIASKRNLLFEELRELYQTCKTATAAETPEACEDKWWKIPSLVEGENTIGRASKIVEALCGGKEELAKYEACPFKMTGECEMNEYAGSYSSFVGSPMHQGKFQFDLWDNDGGHTMHDWEHLRAAVAKQGIRNSLLLAPMPTASTSQIMGNTECFEVMTSNIYSRRVLAGEYTVQNKHLIQDLIDMGIWNSQLKDEILYEEGSVQNIKSIPASVRTLYKTVWETSQKIVIDMAADRGRYICQSQSMNIHIAQPTVNQLYSMLFYAWKKGLKTGSYYLRTKPASKAQQFSIDPSMNNKAVRNNVAPDEPCLSCSA